MKRGKMPSFNDRRKLQKSGVDPQKWLISKKQGNQWLLVHREVGTTREVFVF
ncbi:DUF6906 family protein [Brevibacillus centrosporus]|uniref:DUF6906 family protein n=1 Tax=Brevibacillus centrosporus TaxID=54910 RepID=UPI002E24208A|nr:hypothetical protein [Brevibacillus centrosporus]